MLGIRLGLTMTGSSTHTYELSVYQMQCCETNKNLLKDTLKAYDDFKNKQKSVRSNVF